MDGINQSGHQDKNFSPTLLSLLLSVEVFAPENFSLNRDLQQ
jgi:hypothetical protein